MDKRTIKYLSRYILKTPKPTKIIKSKRKEDKPKHKRPNYVY